jgi:F-type H+-transporting ATPase subunit epsilon
MPIQCEIVTQDKLLYEGPADLLLVPGAKGEMGILPNHAPLLSTLDIGILRVRFQGQEEAFSIAGGIIEVQPDLVTVLADVGEHVAEIDEARAMAARKRAEELLKEGPPPDMDEYLAIQAALRRSRIRLDAVRRYRGSDQQRRPPFSNLEED